MIREVSFLIIIRFLSVVRGYDGLDSSTGSYDESTTTREQLMSDEDGVFWKKINIGRSESDHRSFHSDASDLNLPGHSDDLNKITLREFLEKFSKKQNQETFNQGHSTRTNLDKLIQEQDGKTNFNDKAKRWTLLDVQKHNHPFEDKKGWVSLEPIPWSISKISKWQSKYKPTDDRPWDETGPVSSQRPYSHEDDNVGYKRPISITPPSPYLFHHSTESSDRYDPYYDVVDRPRPTSPSSVHPRPTAIFGHKIHVEAHFPSNSYSSTGKPHLYHNQKDCSHPSHPFDEIMTDGMPSNFPPPNPYDSLRRRGTDIELHPETHPSSGEGEWVLLSTTKGYKPPRNRQRSLDLATTSDPTQALRTTRGIRLTVLPPLKGSKVNMTTSHGGLLQVESTFESVEQAKQRFDKKQNKLKRKRRKNLKKHVKQPVEETEQAVATVARTGTDPRAIMAAVGAGMIPATMAIMVPIAMNGG